MIWSYCERCHRLNLQRSQWIWWWGWWTLFLQ